MRELRIGLAVGDDGTAEGGLEGLLEPIRGAEVAGFQDVWVANIFGFDAMSLAALAARETKTIGLGTAVVPTHSRHPVYMAQQALSTQAAASGRFSLGVGPSHKIVIENMLGLSFDKPARHMREYVSVLRELLDTGKTSFGGSVYRVNASLNVSGASRIPLLIGALRPQMCKIAGSLCDGTITWMTGPRALGEKIVPAIRTAAEAAARPTPRIVCGLPVALTDDVAGAREAANKAYALYGTLPSYRAMLDEEGAAGPGDVLVAGDAAAIERALEGLRSAGVTDLNANIFPYGSDRTAAAARTYELLSELARR